MSAGGNIVELSAYIVAFAGAAATAQKLMSTGVQPMQIKQYMFDINITADYTVNSSTDVSMTIFGIGIKEQLTLGYESKMGIEVKCTIVPLVVIAADNT
ncbi:MAG: hypothetical protein ACN4GR_17480 [Arenicellales bacterium]